MASGDNGSAVSIRESLLNSLDWRLIGPHRGGRVVAVAGDVTDRQTFYFGACAGGVWKTTDGGITWRNVSDGFFNTAAVGALAVSRSDPNVIYAGMGEASIRGNVVAGDGVYKSTDAGRTWTHVGLSDTKHIGKIQIHPSNPDLVYVAALGHAYGPNENRGLFRTNDGGKTWERVLFVGPSAGSHDVSLDLTNPRILYVSIWQTQRYPHTLISGGEQSGIWRSTDGGDSWTEITRNDELPKGMLGKIGVVTSPARAGRVWALVEAEDGAVFRSDDYGESWIRLSEEPLLRTRPWYYMHITADTQDADTVYVQNYSIWRSTDSGATFTKMPTPHGDEHALWIDPNDNARMIDGNDGGACVSYNAGVTWSTILNQPTAQLYHVTTDDQFPYRVYGSQQDNTAISIPSQTTDAAIHERTWYAPGGGESGYISIKPDEPWHVVASGPAGRRAYNDIMTHYDHRTGQIRNITVWPELYGWGAGAESLKYRLQWTFPIMFSQHAPHPLYVAGNVLFRSNDLGSSFEVISPDLTRNDPEKLKPSGGPVTRDNTGAEVYCTIFALAESPFKPGELWAGSDDGFVHRSADGGKTWTDVTPPDLPEWALISVIELSPHEEECAYIAATRYKLDDTAPYLFKTTDNGKTWHKITCGIPNHDFTRVIREDPNKRGLLYAGTESGLYISFDDGGDWHRLAGNIPVVPVHDLTIKGLELVVATHGRSFWILDDVSVFHQVPATGANHEVQLLTPKPTIRLRRNGGYGDPHRGVVNYGHAGTSITLYDPVNSADGSSVPSLLTAGANPPQGVVFHYFLPAEVNDVSLTFKDEKGTELRTYSSDSNAESPRVPAASGMNRFVWNLRTPGVASPSASDLDPWTRSDGPMVLPGTYQAVLTAGGESVSTSFEILPDPRLTASKKDLAEQRDYLLEVLAELDQTSRSIDAIDSVLGQLDVWQQRTEDAKVLNSIESVGSDLRTLRSQLIDVHMRGSQLWPSGIHEKLNALLDSADGADYAPPQQARDVFAELSHQLDSIKERLADLEKNEIATLNQAIADQGLAIIGVPA